MCAFICFYLILSRLHELSLINIPVALQGKDSSMELDTKINLVAIPPLMSQEQFAVFVGKGKTTVRGWVATRAIPTVKIGGSRLINFEKLRADLRNGKTEFSRGDYDE